MNEPNCAARKALESLRLHLIEALAAPCENAAEVERLRREDGIKKAEIKLANGIISNANKGVDESLL